MLSAHETLEKARSLVGYRESLYNSLLTQYYISNVEINYGAIFLSYIFSNHELGRLLLLHNMKFEKDNMLLSVPYISTIFYATLENTNLQLGDLLISDKVGIVEKLNIEGHPHCIGISTNIEDMTNYLLVHRYVHVKSNYLVIRPNYR